MPEVDQIRTAVNAYVDSFNRGDRAKFLDAMAEDVEQFEPVGTAPNQGKGALAGFWNTLFGSCERIDLTVVDLIIAGDEAAMAFHLVQQVSAGNTVEINGVDTFRVNDAGKITLIKGYSDAAHVRSTGTGQ